MKSLVLTLPLLLAAEPALQSSPDLGKAEGRCRPGEGGPALLRSEEHTSELQSPC